MYSTDQILSREVDRTGNEVTVFKTDSLIDSRIYPFFLVQMANLMDYGFAWKSKHWEEENCGAVYAVFEDKILGHIVYEHLVKERSLWITLSSVDPDQRNKGIYSILHRHYERLAKDLNCTSISSMVHKNNKVRLQSAEKVGLKPFSYYMIKRL